MKPQVGLAVLLLVAGCNPPFKTFPPMTDEGCRRVAENDPAVQIQRARYTGGSLRDSSSLDEAVGDAYQKCLRARGGGDRRGGVELPRRGF